MERIMNAYTDEQIQEHLGAFTESGDSIALFCKRSEIPPTTFRGWLKEAGIPAHKSQREIPPTVVGSPDEEEPEDDTPKEDAPCPGDLVDFIHNPHRNYANPYAIWIAVDSCHRIRLLKGRTYRKRWTPELSDALQKRDIIVLRVRK